MAPSGFAELHSTMMSSAQEKSTVSTLPPNPGHNLSYSLVTLSQVLVGNSNWPEMTMFK